MPAAPPIVRVAILSTHSTPERRLRPLISVLDERGIDWTLVRTTKEAGQTLFKGRTDPQAVIVDLSHDSPVGYVSKTIAMLTTTLPFLAPVVVSQDPPPPMMLAAFRAGAADLINIAREDRPGIGEAIDRMAISFQRLAVSPEEMRRLKGLLADFVEITENTAKDARPKPPTVALAAADTATNLLLKARLADVGLTVRTYASKDELVASIASQPPDLAVVDFELADGNGYHAVEEARRHEPTIPYYFVIPASSPQLALRAAELGVSGLTMRPFKDLASLVNRLRDRALFERERRLDQARLQRVADRHRAVVGRLKTVMLESSEG